MKNLFLLLVSVLFVASCGSSLSTVNRSSQNLDEVENEGLRWQRVNDAVVSLVRTDENGVKPFCTGAWVTADRILTAAHCVDDEDGAALDNVTVSTYRSYLDARGRNERKTFVADIISYNADVDLAVLKVARNEHPGRHSVLLVSKTNPEVGENVFSVGHPMGLEYTLSTGIVSRSPRILCDDEDRCVKWIQAESKIFFGNSGGPLINERGEIVGVAHSIYGQLFYGYAAHLGMFSHPKYIRAIINLSYINTEFPRP